MSQDSEAFIREIEEEVRREQMLKLWSKYGTYFIGGLVGLVLLVGGWQWYTAYQRDLAQRAGGQFQEAIALLADDKKKAGGLAGLEQIAKSGTAAYAALAKLRLAGEHRESGKTDEALALYTAVSNDTSADNMLRSFASLQIASLKVDDGSWTEVQNRLNELADESSPWRFTARELLGLAAYKQKRWEDAKQAYTALLANQSTPQDVRVRAQTALALITREASGEGDAKKTTQQGAVPSDLKKDKSSSDGPKPTAGAAETKAPAMSNGAGATNDADNKK